MQKQKGVMTSKDIFNKSFPQDKQIGGSHYKNFTIQPYEFISKNDLSFLYDGYNFPSFGENPKGIIISDKRKDTKRSLA